MSRRLITLVAVVAVGTGCGTSELASADGSTPSDGGRDAGLDAGVHDASVDAGSDASVDGGPDASVDAGRDGGLDAGPDASVDAGSDSGVDAGPADGGPDAGVRDAGADAGADAGSDGGSPVDLCPAGERRCLAHDQRRSCGATPNGLRWLDQTCAPGSGCVLGDCVVGACSDECTLGDSDGGVTCELYDVPSGTWVSVDAGGSLHDRARDYTRWLRRDGMAAGSVGNARYSDPPVYSVISSMDGIGDSALWTGTYLAAEALRLQSTGASDARANIVDLARRLHLLMAVSGSPGNLARFARPSSVVSSFTIGDLDCANQRVHCGVTYQGVAHDYIGHVSRDQYQGIVLGSALAWEALGSEDLATKDLLRDDVVTLVKELMRERQVPLSITFNGITMPTSTVTARFMVLNPAEMSSGALVLTASLSGGASEMWGFQEFYPDLADLVRQVPGLSWSPAIPRASSAIMLASFFQVALHMTENDPRAAVDHAAILAYYTSHSGQGGNIADWLTIAHMWAPGTGCNQSYFGNNITFEPLYNLSRLETDPTRRADIQNNLFTTRIWPTFAPTKNPFFSFIYAGTVSGVASSVPTTAVTQLAQFPVAPRIHFATDLRTDPRYAQHEPGCTDQLVHTSAVDVRDRVVSDFIWQRDPWQLFDWGDVNATEPGVDYLVAYWMGRKHGFITEDSTGRCLARH